MLLSHVGYRGSLHLVADKLDNGLSYFSTPLLCDLGGVPPSTIGSKH